MFIELEQKEAERFYHDVERNMLCEGPSLHKPNVTINTDYIVSMVEHKNLHGEFDHTEIVVMTGQVYKVIERVSNIKEEMRRYKW